MNKKQIIAQFYANYYADKARIQRLIEGYEFDYFSDKTISPFQSALRICAYRKKLKELNNETSNKDITAAKHDFF